MSRRRRLYRGESGRRTRSAIIRRYEREGERPARARETYGRIVGTVARERAAKRRGGEMRERVRGHLERRNGRVERVRPHWAIVHAVPHSRGHHAGRCTSACRRGLQSHRHARRRRRR